MRELCLCFSDWLNIVKTKRHRAFCSYTLVRRWIGWKRVGAVIVTVLMLQAALSAELKL